MHRVHSRWWNADAKFGPRLGRFVVFTWQVVLDYRRWDVWHCNDAEAFALGVLAKRIRPRLQLIYDCHEFEAEAASLSEMIDLAREHAEFTKPILDLLDQLQAKLVAERDALTIAASNAKNAHATAQATSATACGKVEAKRIEA